MAEENFKDENAADILKLGLTKKDLLNYEKSQLKQDAMLLDRIIKFDENQNILINMEG